MYVEGKATGKPKGSRIGTPFRAGRNLLQPINFPVATMGEKKRPNEKGRQKCFFFGILVFGYVKGKPKSHLRGSSETSPHGCLFVRVSLFCGFDRKPKATPTNLVLLHTEVPLHRSQAGVHAKPQRSSSNRTYLGDRIPGRNPTPTQELRNFNMGLFCLGRISV